MKHLLSLLLLAATCLRISAGTNDLLIIVEKAIHDRLTEFPAYLTAVCKERPVEVIAYETRTFTTNVDSRGRTNIVAGPINNSSRAARVLATNIIWPRVMGGVRHVLLIGELPVPVSGLNVCPDGHSDSYTFDGWRGVQNSAGAYKAMQFYGCPAPFGARGGWLDDSHGELSIAVSRQNAPGDGRFDNDYLPAQWRAAVGWVGGFGDLGTDSGSLDRRATGANNYLRRVTAYRDGAWPAASGACYEYVENFNDPHASQRWLENAREAFGGRVTINAKTVLTGGSLTNRTNPFCLTYSGSDWGAFVKNLGSPFTVGIWDHLSFSKETPNSGNRLGRLFLDSPNYGPLIVMPWDPPIRLDLTQLTRGATFGEMYLAAVNAPGSGLVRVYIGLLGDPSLRIRL